MTVLGQISPVAFDLFGWPVRWYGLIIGLGIAVAYGMIQAEAKRKQLNEEHVSDIVFWTIILGFIGARIYYVVFQWDYYSQHLNEVFSIWNGGIAVYGGILAGLLSIYFLTRHFKVDFINFLDVVAPAVMLAQAIGRWGNFINQEAHGPETTRQFLANLHLPNWLIEQMAIDGVYYHPTFLYESLWNVIGVLVLLWLRTRPQWLKRGEVAAGYLGWYGLGRMWIEGMRTDSLYFAGLRVSQWLAALFVIVSLAFIIIRRRRGTEVAYTADRL